MKTTKRSKKGQGSLYVRGKDGKRYKAGSRVEGGVYVLEYHQPTADGTKKRRVTLKHSEDIPEEGIEKGDSVKKLSHAEAERVRITSRFVLADTEDKLTLLAADIEKTRLERAIAEDTAVPPLALSDAWEAYLDSDNAPQSGQDTLLNYKSHWKQFLEWLGKEYPSATYLRDITPEVSKRFAAQFKRSDSSPTTYNQHIGFLKLIFKTLHGDDSIDSRLRVDPFAKTKKLKRNTQSRRELTIPELRTVIDNADDELKTLLLLGATTGMRLGDCSTLLWNEVSFEKGLVTRAQNKQKHRTGVPPLKIGMPPELINRLKEIMPANPNGYVVPWFAELYTFRNENGRLSKQPKISRTIQKHFEDCGIRTHRQGTGPTPEQKTAYRHWYLGGKKGPRPTYSRAVIEVGFHSLRHTYVSLQAERGVPQSVVQKTVGHGNPAMTQHYTHISDQVATQATLSLAEGAQDADFEEVPTPIPPWARKRLEKATAKDWKKIIAEVLEVK